MEKPGLGRHLAEQVGVAAHGQSGVTQPSQILQLGVCLEDEKHKQTKTHLQQLSVAPTSSTSHLLILHLLVIDDI